MSDGTHTGTGRLAKIGSAIIALCGLWEFGDLAALFVPDFGPIPAFLWSHIGAGLALMVLGTWAAVTRSPGTARRLHGVAMAAGLWLIAAPFVLGHPVAGAGLWNDLIVGLVVAGLGGWLAWSQHTRATPR